MIRCGFILGIMLIGLAFAQQGTVPLVINGQAVSVPAIVVDGRTYLPLDVLEAAGMLVTRDSNTLSVQFGPPVTGGANEVTALEGCMHQWLFNGVWRLQVTDIMPFHLEDSAAGWDVTVEMRNGSDRSLKPSDAGIDGGVNGVFLALEDETVLNLYPGDKGHYQTDLILKELPPGGAAQTTFRFRSGGTRRSRSSSCSRLTLKSAPISLKI